MAKNAVITGWGFHAPSRVVTNQDLEKIVDTSDEWITSRTGIKERRFASDGENTSSMSVRAARFALEKAKLRPQDVQLIIVGTCSPDYLFPATACIVQSELGATRAGAFDVEAACTSFVTALGVARGMIMSGTIENALVIGAETLSRFLNFKDRTTCVLFGDGAGAVVVEASTAETLERGQHFITMQGGEVFKLAVKSMADAAEEAIREAGLGLDDIAIMIPHQANVRIIEGVAKRLHFPIEKVFVNIQRYGNTSAASIPIAMAEAAGQGRLRRGDKVLLVAFGGGFTWGASVLEWFGPHDGIRPPSPLERAREAIEDVVDRVRPL